MHIEEKTIKEHGSMSTEGYIPDDYVIKSTCVISKKVF